METSLRAALIDWLASDPVLSAELNAISEEAPSRSSLPWLAIAASGSIDWGSKTHEGREVRVALELNCRGDAPDAAATLVSAIEQRLAQVPRDQPGYRIVTLQFLRSRAEQRAESTRAILLEYRFRLISQ